MKVALEVDTDLFSTRPYRLIAEKAVAYLATYNKPPKVHLRDILEEELKRGDDGKLLSTTIDAMERMLPDMNIDYVVEQIAFFVRKQHMTKTSEEFAALIHKGKLDEADQVLNKLEPAKLISGTGIWSHDLDAMTRFMDEDEGDLFSSGVDVLDRKGLRPKRGRMMALIAPPKKGKSWFCINCAKRALIEGKRVLHISTENSEKETAQRYIQAFLSMSVEDEPIRLAKFIRDENGGFMDISLEDIYTPVSFRSLSKQGVQKKLKAMSRRSKLLIKEFPGGTLSVSQMDTFIKFLVKQYNFKPDLVILDQPSQLHFSGAASDRRIEIGRSYVHLRTLAVQHNYALVTVAQCNRGSMAAKLVHSDMAAEDISLIATADAVITYSQTTNEKRLGLARLFVTQCRYAEDGYIVNITQQYKVGQFCLDSVYMTNDVQTISNRLTGEDADRPQRRKKVSE